MREIAATKAYGIGRRGGCKDYIDLYFIVSDCPRHQCRGEKFGFEFNSRLFLEQIVFLEDLEDTDIQFLKTTVTRAELRDVFYYRCDGTVEKIESATASKPLTTQNIMAPER